MSKFIPLLALIGMLGLGTAQHASAETRFGVYVGTPGYNYTPAPQYGSQYYAQPYAAPYSAYGYYDEPRWRDDHWRREREHREHEWRERERREHERREHRDHDRDRW